MWDINSDGLLKRVGFLIVCLGVVAYSPVDLKAIEEAPFKPDSSWKGLKSPLPKRGNYALPTGFTFEAVLEGAIFSYNLLTPAVAVLEEPILFQSEVVFPKGTKLVGQVGVLHTLDRVNIDFRTVVFPDGQEIRGDFLGLSMDGSAGVKGKVETHKDAVAAKIAMKSVLAGVQSSAAAGVPTVESSIASGLSQQSSSDLDTSSVKTVESISIEERTPLKIMLRERLEF